MSINSSQTQDQRICKCGSPATRTIYDGPLQIKKYRCYKCFLEQQNEQVIKDNVVDFQVKNNECLLKTEMVGMINLDS